MTKDTTKKRRVFSSIDTERQRKTSGNQGRSAAQTPPPATVSASAVSGGHKLLTSNYTRSADWKCKSPSLGSNRMRDFFCFVVLSLVASTQRRSCFSAMTPATGQSILLKVLVGDRTAAGASTAGTQRPRG